MIVVLKPNPNPEQVQGFISWLEGKGIAVHKSVGVNETVFGLVGDTASLDIGLIAALDIVEDVKRIVEPYKDANRKFHPEDPVIPVGNTPIGGGTLTIMAGPCSVESEEQLVGIAKAVKASGANRRRDRSNILAIFMDEMLFYKLNRRPRVAYAWPFGANSCFPARMKR